jgi:electron transport complex protein RnfB
MACFITADCIGCMACLKTCPTKAIDGRRDVLHVINPDLCIECEACGRVCPKSAVKNYKNEIIARLKKADWIKPTIIVEKCVACENCVEVCPTGALTMLDEHLPLTQNRAVLSHEKNCVSCYWCFNNCQYEAIIMEVQK